MHSSRMCTGHSLTICCSLLPGGGVCFCFWGGVCSGVSALGGVCSGGDVCPGGCLLWGVSARGSALGGGRSTPGVSALGDLLQGVSAPGGCLLLGGCIPACTEADTLPPLWTEFLTLACENITLAQLRCGR